MATQKARRVSTSIATVGSSRTTRLGSGTTARANSTRWRWPPERVSILRSPRSPMPASSSARPTGRGAVHRGDERDRLADLQVAEQAAGLQHRAHPPDRTARRGRDRRRGRSRCRAGAGRAASRWSSSCPRRWGRAAPPPHPGRPSGRRRRPQSPRRTSCGGRTMCARRPEAGVCRSVVMPRAWPCRRGVRQWPPSGPGRDRRHASRADVSGRA